MSVGVERLHQFWTVMLRSSTTKSHAESPEKELISSVLDSSQFNFKRLKRQVEKEIISICSYFSPLGIWNRGVAICEIGSQSELRQRALKMLKILNMKPRLRQNILKQIWKSKPSLYHLYIYKRKDLRWEAIITSAYSGTSKRSEIGKPALRQRIQKCFTLASSQSGFGNKIYTRCLTIKQLRGRTVSKGSH